MSQVHENDIYYTEVVTHDATALCSFYEKMHGWQFQSMGAAMGNSFVAVLPNGSRCGVREPLNENEKLKPLVRTYVKVPDAEQACKRAEELGAVIALEPTELPGQGKIAIYIIHGIEQGVWVPLEKK